MAKYLSKPNIVWLLTDHHIFKHHRDLPGPSPEIPVYDRICREGVEFRQANAVCPLCQPARASLLTGQYPHRHGMVMNDGHCGSRHDFDPDTRLFSTPLREAGYRVGYFGKWHCGDQRLAADYGFEGWSLPDYGHPYAAPEYATYLEELGLPFATVDVEHHMNKPEFRTKGVPLKNEEPFRLMPAGGVLTTPLETHEAYFVNHMASRWIERAASNDQPFFVRIDVWGPHQPYWVAEPFRDTIDPHAIPEYPNYASRLEGRPRFHRDFRDNVQKWRGQPKSWDAWQPFVARAYEHATQVDAAFARILDTLDRLGIAENTLLIYTADHGDAIGSNGGIFDKSAFMIEETMRIPAAVRWPRHVPPGGMSDHLVTNMDFVPTVLDAAGADFLEPSDGLSLLPIAQDPDPATPWRDDLLCEHHGHGFHCFQRMLRWGSFKYVAHLGDIEELYDLNEDLYELNNRSGDPAMAGTLREVRKRLVTSMDRFDDHAPDAAKLKMQIKSR